MELRPYLRKAQFYETDGMGVVYHGNYIHWMEEARTDFMDQIGWGYEKAVEAGIDFALTDISCKYRSMTRFGETVAIHMAVTKLSPAKMEVAYRQAIPRNNSIHVTGDTRALLSSIDRVSLMINEKLKSPLHCIFDENVLKIRTKTAIGDAADQCPISGDGQNLEIGFNNRYLMDALKAAPTDRVRLELSSGVAPCVILPAEGEENFLYMVLPVRLKAGE